MNTILYSTRWPEMVTFYRDVLRLPIVFENEWLVEFHVAASAFVSVADSARASIDAGNGAGLTLSWQVDDVASVRTRLIEAGVAMSGVRERWGSRVAYLVDPVGNRIELWSGSANERVTRPAR